ncbi:uncharacterized protein LOC143446732 isoform X2 [Clavelina lepadiformis]|uniref:uncharacterized protein LOC143446732 isoform X2 n=1 Tax=Clavelina lepadiformis TaxID=159417 RepID=UPI00404271C8
MDDEERKKKLEAGKAKLASFRKKRSSTSKKRKGNDTAASTPRSQSDEVGAGDSIAVQTGDDSTDRALTPSDDTDRSSTTADDISTEEELGYTLKLTAVEKIQELELTVSDQQVALQKLTLENKELHDRNEALLEKSIRKEDLVYKDLRDNVSNTAEYIRQMQQQLIKTTGTVIDTGSEQSQVVAELTETRVKLDTCQEAIARQEKTLNQMSRQLEEKNMEAGDAAEKCRSLRSELDKSQSLLATTEENLSGAVRSLQVQLEQEKQSLQAQLEEEHGLQIAAIKREHQIALEDERRKFKEMEQKSEASVGSFGLEDLQVYREQVALLQSQLETAYRDIDRLKKNHDKEVIQLNQQLVNSVDEYETKLQEERLVCEDLEHKLEMSDTVSSEIQASFSKQLAQLEEERDTLRQQMKQSQLRLKEGAASKKQVKDLEDEVLSYQTELAETSRRLEDTEKQSRQLRDEIERCQNTIAKMTNEKSQFEHNCDELDNLLKQKEEDYDELLKSTTKEKEDLQCTINEHLHHLEHLQAENDGLTASIEQEKNKKEDDMKMLKNEHSEELKNLHSQHHRQMDELKREMEKQLDVAKQSFEEERKEQLETVKDVHERTRDREVSRLQEDHQEVLEKLAEKQKQEINSLKVEAAEIKQMAEERLRIELKEEFNNVLENELGSLQRSLEQESDLAQTELEEKHQEIINQLKEEHKRQLKDSISRELEQQQGLHAEALLAQKLELESTLESLKMEFETSQDAMADEHAEALSKLEAEIEEVRRAEEDKSSNSGKLNEKLKDELVQTHELNSVLKNEMKHLQEKLESDIEDLEQDYKNRLQASDTALEEEKENNRKFQEENEHFVTSLKEELLVLQTERDQIFQQAEESQKRLASLHGSETARLQEEIDHLQTGNQEKINTMQIEIDSLRTSRDDLQDLKKQLLARTTALEDMEKLREEFSQEKEQLLDERKQELEKLRSEHEEETKSYQERVEQLLQDLSESREKLEEVTRSSVQLESSPMRSLSALSDYDSSNVVALNKDYRSEPLSQALEHEEAAEEKDQEVPEPAQSEDSSSSSSSDSASSSSSEDSSQEEEQDEDLTSLQHKVDELKIEIKELKNAHEDAIRKLIDEHDTTLEELIKTKEDERLHSLQEQEKRLEEAHEDLQRVHDQVIEKLKESHRTELTQLRLQCASDTAAQVEEESAALRAQLRKDFDAEKESLKHEMQLESNEKLVKSQKDHEQELSHQADELSSSLELRIAAVMSELHEQKQDALKKASSKHQEELTRLQEEMNSKIQKITDQQEDSQNSWILRREELEADIGKLKDDLEEAKNKYKELTDSLDSGSHERLRALSSQNRDEMETMRMELQREYDEKQENALQKQALIFQQAQEEFMKLHEERLAQFTSQHKDEAESKEQEIDNRIQLMQLGLLQKHEAEKKDLIGSHNEEMKVVATKLVEVDEEKQKFDEANKQLLLQLERLQTSKDEELSDLKTNLVNQHMIKFQEVTANLENLHKEELEKMILEHKEEETRLRDGLIALQKKIDALEAEHEEEVAKLMEELSQKISQEELDARLKEEEENHANDVKRIQNEHDLQLQQIEEEIQKQDGDHKASMQKIQELQQKEFDDLQKQFGEALAKTSETGIAETQKMAERLSELETELQLADGLKSELEETKERQKELEAVIEEYKMKMQAWEEGRKEESETYEGKLEELSEALNAAREEYKDLTTRIEFERAEYEAEIESVQDDARNKDDNIIELQAEIKHKTAALDSLEQQHNQLTERHEREAQEGENLLKLLRDDLERMNKERDSSNACNEQLLKILSDLVQTNQRCEEVIAQRLENLPITGAEPDAQPSLAQSSSNDGGDTDATNTPLNTSLSGSFVDEGLDLSQRLAESMFTGPELDPVARDIVTGAGNRVKQATERLLDMLENSIKQLNTAQQAQTILGDELEKAIEAKQKDEDVTNEKAELQEQLQHAEDRITELEVAISEQNEAFSKLTEASGDIQEKEHQLRKELVKLEDERSLLKKQKEALKDGRDETELNLLRATEELANEKQMLIERHDEEKSRLENAAHHLEDAVEQVTRATEEKETAYLAQIDDLNTQVEALRKRTESGSRFTAQLSIDREFERDQFEKEMEAMRNEVDQARDSARSGSMLADKRRSLSLSGNDPNQLKVAYLEEDLDLSQQLRDETVEEVEKLKRKIEEKEDTIKQLRERLSRDELETAKSQAASLQLELEESQRQQEVLQQELYANMLRISALEGQLDRYRHGIDEDIVIALERAEAELRRLQEKEKEELEAKDMEIENLVEQQNSLHTQILEKEELIEKLRQNIEQIESENSKLKNHVDNLQLKPNDSHLETAPVTQSEQLEALSHRLLDEKNAEIDELRQQVMLLRSDVGDEDSSQGLLLSLQTRARELAKENEELKDHLRITEEQLQEALSKVDSMVPPEVVEVSKDESPSDAGDTGIHEVDLTVHDLIQQDNNLKIQSLEEENANLQEQLDVLRKQAEDLIAKIDVFNIPASTKEKIRDLQERLEKEKENISSSSSSSDDEESSNTQYSLNASLTLTHNNNIGSEVIVDGKSVKGSNIIREKLDEIEEELKTHGAGVLSRILEEKDEHVMQRDAVIHRLEHDISANKAQVDTLLKQVAKLKHELQEPDVRIRMQGDEKEDKNDSTIKVEKDAECINLGEKEERFSVCSKEEEEVDTSSHTEQDGNTATEESNASIDASEKASSLDSSSVSSMSDHPDAPEKSFTEEHGDDQTTDVEELKFLLDAKEKEISDRDHLIEQKENELKHLQEVNEANVAMESTLKERCDEIKNEFEEYKFAHPDDVFEHPSVQEEVNRIKEELEVATSQAAAAREDCSRMSKQLDDIQRECASLLDDNHKLEQERKGFEDKIQNSLAKVEKLEFGVEEKDAKLKEVQEKTALLESQVQEATDALHSVQVVAEETANARNMLQVELNRVTGELESTRVQLQHEMDGQLPDSLTVPSDGSGETLMQKEHTEEILSFHPHHEEESVEVARLIEENETLREEINNLTFKTEELEMEIETMKQAHTDECNNLSLQHEREVGELEKQLKLDLSQLEASFQASPVEPVIAVEVLQQSTDMQPVRLPSTDSKSSNEELEEKMEEVKKEHQIKMEEMQKKYTLELEEAVAKAVKQQEQLDEEKLLRLQEKHRKEMSEILSESINGDGELAHQLTAELDHADKLDKNLIEQLTAATQAPENAPVVVEDLSSSLSSSPTKEAEISSRLQHLLSRLHNEGVQVLSLSELQFLKEHQDSSSVDTNGESDLKDYVDVDGLKRAWESEKLALLDAIQALKELLTQTASEAAQSSEDDESLKWRGDLLRAVADLFERERRALLAELQASVIEARAEAEKKSELGAASRLEALERKIRSQQNYTQTSLCTRVWDLAFTSELLRLRHEIRRLMSFVTSTSFRDVTQRSELERLLTADRDQLVQDVKQLRAERKEKLDQAYDRIKQLQEQHKMAEELSRQTLNSLQSQLECLKSKVQQEEAITDDLRTSLESEKQRSQNLVPALQRERERTLELSSEMAALSQETSNANKNSHEQIDKLRSQLDAANGELTFAEEKMKHLEEEKIKDEEDRKDETERMERLRAHNQKTITELQEALGVEEKRRQEAVSAVETERRNVTQLHQELASERAASYNEVVQLKNKCEDLTAAVQAEQGRCLELRAALEQEVTHARHAREELENQRKMSAEAREHDRATVADLQTILEDAKRETERIQNRVEVAEQEREDAINRAEDEQATLNKKLQKEKVAHDEAITRERKARTDLQSVLEAERLRNQEVHQNIQDLENKHRELLKERERMSTPPDVQDALLTNRRQLESLRQRLQLEASKLQNMTDRTPHRPSPRDQISPFNSLLSTDGERIESLKRSLQDMQGELKDLYSNISLPERGSLHSSVRPIEFNDKLLQQNAELSEYAADAAKEVRELKDEVAALKRDKKLKCDDGSTAEASQQKMAAKMHKIYTRYLRAESFKKSLIYQKKYLLLLLGGFQDCEEATLALIARMGAYPSNDALRGTVTNRSVAFTRFRSAVRVVIAVCRLKFLVRKWKRANHTVSAAIQSKHGPPAQPSTSANGVNSGRRTESLSPYPHSISRTPSPHINDSITHRPGSSRGHDHHLVSYYHNRYSGEPPSHDTSSDRYKASTSPYTSAVPRSTGYRGAYDRDYSFGSVNGEIQRYSPTASTSYSAMDRSHPAESDPSLNEYIRKLENIQHHLRYPK